MIGRGTTSRVSGPMDQAVRANVFRRAHRRLVSETTNLLDALAPLRVYAGLARPTVYYGRRKTLGIDDASRGGFVKLQYMQGAFPNAPRNANILYLASSALPERANLLMRAADLRRMRLVWNQNGVAYPGWHGPGWEAVNARMRNLMARARHVFYQSAFCRMASARFLEPRDGGAEVLPNPVDTSRFLPVGPPTRPERLVILAGGTCYQRYRLEVAALTLRCLVDAGLEARLRFAGRPAWGPEATRETTELLAQLGLSDRVEFVGPYTQREAPAIIASTHVLLHTKYNDNCPTLVLEAMACGLPVVYSASGGTPELVGPNAGIGIPAPLDWERPHPPDPESLADAIRQILGEYAERSAAARRRAVEHFDVHPWLDRHRLVFERILEER